MKKSFSRLAGQNLLCLFYIYVLCLFCFAIFRFTLLFFHTEEFVKEPDKYTLLFRAFLLGWRFDTVICGYILSLPIVVSSVLILLRRMTPRIMNIVYGYMMLLFSLTFIMCTVDIPFFIQFFNRLNDTVFLWNTDAGFAFEMIVKEPSFFGFVFLFIIVETIFVVCMLRIRKYQKKYLPERNTFMHGKQVLIYLVTVFLLFGTFLGIRGRITLKSPIQIGMAYFCNNPFLNQLGLNPAFTLLKSYLETKKSANKPLAWIDNQEALEICKEIFGGHDSLNQVFPIARPGVINEDSCLLGRRNVVLILLEGIGGAKMNRFGNDENLTPFLDSLAQNAWSFDNIYSAGIHTFNGIYSTLFSHPALMKRHSMKVISPAFMSGFPNVLSEKDYQTCFFITHDELFDNVSGYLYANNFRKIIGQKDYPAKEVKSNLGVPDHYMFEFSIPVLNELAEKGTPFFTTMMTASNHQPYIVPDNIDFKPKDNPLSKQVTEYADWSLKHFMELASQQSWYENTLFVFVADHGFATKEAVYDILLSYHHIPFIVYAPGFTETRSFDVLGLQVDVFPTIMGLLGENYINNTFGINLLKEERDHIVFSTDDKLACMTDSLLYIYRMNSKEGIYEYRNQDPEDYADKYPEELENLRKKAFAWLQTSQWMIENRKTSIP